MSYITTLYLDFSSFENFQTIDLDIAFLEEKISQISPNCEMEITENSICIANFQYIDRDDISFRDYQNEWKMVKDFCIESGIFDHENYKQFFTLKRQEIFKNQEKYQTNKDLDAMIAKVDKNDLKLLDIMNQIKNIKKSL